VAVAVVNFIALGVPVGVVVVINNVVVVVS